MKLHCPEEKPNENDVSQVRANTVKEISLFNVEEYNFWTAKEYVDLRDFTISSRLTLFNTMRGGEQMWLLLSE